MKKNMKTLLTTILLLLALSTTLKSQSVSTNSTNKVDYMTITVLEHRGGDLCLVQFKGTIYPIEVILRNAPTTLYKDVLNVFQREQYITVQQQKLDIWKHRLDYIYSQIPAAFQVDSPAEHMQRAYQAEVAYYKAQDLQLDRIREKLQDDKQTIQNRPAYHHPINLRVYTLHKKVDNKAELFVILTKKYQP